MRFLLVVSLLLSSLSGAVYGGTAPLLKLVTHPVSRVPALAKIQIKIPSDARNRTLCIVWEAEDGYGSSCQTLDGIETPLTVWRDIKLFRGGEWHIMAVIGRDDNTTERSNDVIVHVLD